MPWRRKGPRRAEGPIPDNLYPELRMMALNIVPSEVGLHPSPELPTVFGGVMDIARPEGVVTFVMLADGMTSMYTSTGGGHIGLGGYEAVKLETRGFLLWLEEHVDDLEVDACTDTPGPAMVVFYALTRSGRRRAEVSLDALVSERHPLSPLFVLGNRVITAARLSDGWGQER